MGKTPLARTISITAYNRPELLRGLLDSIRNQVDVDLSKWKLHICIDGEGDRQEEVVGVARSVDFMPSHRTVFLENVGINRATYKAVEIAYNDLRSDVNLYLEDDLVLSPDALALCEWFLDQNRLRYVAGLCLFNRRSIQEPASVRLVPWFTGWGFLMYKVEWEVLARSVWLNGKSMWDNRVANSIKSHGFRSAIPRLSRSTNVGIEGEHFKGDKLERFLKGHKYQRQERSFDYHLEE